MKRILCLTAALILLLTGCAVPEQEEPEKRGYYDFIAVTDIEPDRPDVYAVLKVCTTQFWQQLIDGIAAGGREFGCNVYVGGTTNETDWELQSQLLDLAVERGADALLFTPSDSTRQSDAVSRIHAAGTPIVLVDTILNGAEYDICLMTDNVQAGQAAAKKLLAQLRTAGVKEDEPAQIAIQVGALTSQTLMDRVAGFSQYWSQNAPREWTILDDVKCNEGNRDRATQYCHDFIRDYPQLKGVFGCNDGSTVGFARGLLELERTDIVFVGFDYSEPTARLVNDGRWEAATLVQRQFNMGYQGVFLARKLQDPNWVPERRVIDTGVELVTRDNSGEQNIQRLLNQVNTYTFTEVWP